MIPLVEDTPQEMIVQIAERRFGMYRMGLEGRLNELAQSNDPIIRAYAIYQIGIMGLDSISKVIQQNLDYNHFFVQEVVVWAIMYAGADDELQPLLQRQTKSQFKTVRAYAERLLLEVAR